MPNTGKLTDRELGILAQVGWTATDISLEYGVTVSTIQRRARKLGCKLRRENSQGNRILRSLLSQTFYGARIEEEYHLGERLRLDFYLPEYRLAIEFDGSQHQKYSEFFHGNHEAFAAAQARDQRKIELCDLKDITLVRYTSLEQFKPEFLLRLALANAQRETVDLTPEKVKPKYQWVRPPTKPTDPDMLEKQRLKRHKRYKQAKLWKESQQLHAQNRSETN